MSPASPSFFSPLHRQAEGQLFFCLTLFYLTKVRFQTLLFSVRNSPNENCYKVKKRGLKKEIKFFWEWLKREIVSVSVSAHSSPTKMWRVGKTILTTHSTFRYLQLVKKITCDALMSIRYTFFPHCNVFSEVCLKHRWLPHLFRSSPWSSSHIHKSRVFGVKRTITALQMWKRASRSTSVIGGVKDSSCVIDLCSEDWRRREKKTRLFFEFLTCQFKHTFKITRILCAFMLSELYLKCRKSLSFLTCAWIRAAPGAKDVMGFFLLFFSTSVQIRRVLRVTSQRIYRVCSIASFVTSFFFMRIKYGNL